MLNSLSLAGQKITSQIDRLNDRITSYRLVLYFLIILVGWAILGSFSHNVAYNWHQILVSAGWLVLVCWFTNKLISKFLDIPANKESDLITALILSLILTPPSTAKDFAITGVVGAAAMASKYIITYRRSHLFNPAAFGAFVASRLLSYDVAWWVGTKFITPIVVIGGILILRKMKRYSMSLVFLAVYILYLIYGTNVAGNLHNLWLELIATPTLFLAVIMLTEPLTSPTTLYKGLLYSILVGVLYSVTRFGFSPEESLLVGNLFTFLVAHNQRYKLKFIRRIEEAQGIYSYLFAMPKDLKFKAGQYMEWTVAHNKTDSRGNRRYLTIASAPNEPGVMFTIKQPDKASAFKQKLAVLKPGETILAGHLAGSFTLPKDSNKKLAFLAGGIGVTPFRSMVADMLKSNQTRDTVLIYSANSEAEIAFKKYFAEASRVGLRTEYLTKGYLDEPKLKKLLPDFKSRRIYLSGPYGFVSAVEAALLRLGTNPSEIMTDYFPGYAS
jgi:ferredoxin-NADP reductase/Na+-translocating ferredoxin:NAD+ oxidoreductase RnfD subunit